MRKAERTVKDINQINKVQFVSCCKSVIKKLLLEKDLRPIFYRHPFVSPFIPSSSQKLCIISGI